MKKLESLKEVKLPSTSLSAIIGGVYLTPTWQTVTLNQATMEGNCSDTYNLLHSDDGHQYVENCTVNC
jgi:hypothetical protein